MVTKRYSENDIQRAQEIANEMVNSVADERYALTYKPQDERIAGLKDAIELMDTYLNGGGTTAEVARLMLMQRLRNLSE